MARKSFKKIETRWLARIAEALERLAPPPLPAADFSQNTAFIWHGEAGFLQAVAKVTRLDLALLKGISAQREQLLANTRQFAQGLAANNALLWGARGMGKSSLVKAVHGEVTAEVGGRLKLIELARDEISTLPLLLDQLRQQKDYRFIIFCDDLSFDGHDSSYKSLKTALEGSIAGGDEHVVFYATSNRRHLLARDMIENESSTAIAPSEAVQEKVSLSDRFGLWLGFHACSQDDYLAMIDSYADFFKLPMKGEELHREALAWAVMRGNRSGRVAWQFMRDQAGQAGLKLADLTLQG